MIGKFLVSITLVMVCLCHTSQAAAFAKVVRISTSTHSLLSDHGSPGMLEQLIKEAFRRINIHAEIVYVSAKRSVIAANEGGVEGVINRIAGMDQHYPNLVRVPEPNMQMRFVAFATRDIPISGWHSLTRLKVGAIRGWKIMEQHLKGVLDVTFLTDISNLFKMLKEGRLDVVLYSEMNGYDVLHRLGYDGIYHLSPPLSVEDMYLYLHKDHKELALPVAEALREMKQDGTYDRLVSETIRHRPGTVKQ